MSTTKKIIIVVVVLVAIALGYYFWKKSKAKKATDIATGIAAKPTANAQLVQTALVSGIDPAAIRTV